MSSGKHFGCCDRCGEAIRQLSAATARAEELERQLADVKTLDEWRNNPPSLIVYGKPMTRSRVIRYGECGGRVLLATIAVMMPGVPGDSPDDEAREIAVWFDGETDDEARAKAAAWVRSQQAKESDDADS